MPVESRKYSAIVRADKATRRRAPGGSFIWPKTMHVWSMTLRPVSPILACCISSHRSLPSRVRSPTPANTEEPPWAEAMRAISSCRMTVLPSPAPPNSPALPPRTKGVSRSMTLMPVSKISVFVERSTTGGASRWMGQYSSALTGPRSSIGSPSRLKTRPSVALPTGTRTGAPVSMQAMPRTMPSVLPRATQRTRPPPSWAWTSPVRRTFTPFCSASIVHGVIDRRQMVLGELRVEGRADDLGHAADLGLGGGGGECCGHGHCD